MGLRDWLKRRKQSKSNDRLRESLFSPFGYTFQDEDQGFRRIGGRNVDRDLDQLSHEKSLKLAYYQYMTNPTARRIVQLTTDFVIGKGMTVVAENEAVQETIDKFWETNDMDQKIHTRALELALYGEQLWPVWVGKNGLVTLGSIDPLRVSEVIVNQHNVEDIQGVVVHSVEQGAVVPKLMPVISKERSGFSEHFGSFKYEREPEEGDPNGVFFFRVNAVSNATRGTSDLLPILDWLDAADQFLWGLLERAALAGMLLWDVTVEDQNGQKVAEYAAKVKNEGGIKPGTVKIHDQSIKWDLRVPNFGSSEHKEAWELIRQQILAGAGLPEHWIFEGGNVNRASAAEMNEPVLRRLRTRQGFLVDAVTRVIEFNLQTTIEAGRLNVAPDQLGFEIVPDRIGGEDQQQQLDRVKTGTEILMSASGTLIPKEDAAIVFENFLREAGVELPNDEQSAAKVEEDDLEESGPEVDTKLVDGYARVIEMARRRAGGES